MLVLGLSRGEVDASESKNIFDAAQRARTSTLRANLYEAMHLTKSPTLRQLLADRILTPGLRPYETRMAVSAFVKLLNEETISVLTELLSAGSDEKPEPAVGAEDASVSVAADGQVVVLDGRAHA